MANLTKVLDSPTSGKPITGGEKTAPSLFSGLADVAVSAFGALDNLDARSRQREQDAIKASDRAAQNAAEQAVYDATMAKAKELEKIRAGVNQGRLPANSLSLSIDTVRGELFNLYPDSKKAIGDVLQARGFDHWEFRELKQQAAAEEGALKAQVETGAAAYKYAFEHGFGHPNASYEENVAAGYKAMAADESLKRLKEQSEARRAAAAEGRAQSNFDQADQDRKTYAAVGDRLDTRLQVFLPQVDALIAAAVGDVEKERKLAEIAPFAGNILETIRQQELSNLGPLRTKEAEEMINNRINVARKSLEDRFSGTLSSYNMTKQATENMKNLFVLNQSDALRAYSEMATIFGKDVINEKFNGSLPFSKEVIKQIGDEIKGYTTSDAAKGRVHLMRMAQLLKGELGLKDLTEAEAIQQMPTIAATLSGSQAALIKGSKEPQTIQNWQASYGLLVEATAEVQPGQRNLSSLWAGVQYVASPGARTILNQLAANPETKEKAMTLAVGSRGSAAQALEVARRSNSSPNQFQSFVFNGAKGEWEVQFDQRGYEKWAAKQPKEFGKITDRGYYPGPPSAADMSKLNKDTRDKLSIMNASLNHLVETAQYDQSIPKGATPKQIREHYAKGTPFVKANGKPMLSSDEEFSNLVDEFKTRAQAESTTGAAPAKLPITDIKFSSGIDALVRTIFLEDPGNAAQVASVILNRAQGKIENIESVVLANNGRTWQFQPWGEDKNRQRGLALDTDSKQYREILAKILPLVNDPSLRQSFTHFYSPQSMNPVGSRPSWDDGSGVDIGPTRFFTNPRGG